MSVLVASTVGKVLLAVAVLALVTPLLLKLHARREMQDVAV